MTAQSLGSVRNITLPAIFLAIERAILCIGSVFPGGFSRVGFLALMGRRGRGVFLVLQRRRRGKL